MGSAALLCGNCGTELYSQWREMDGFKCRACGTVTKGVSPYEPPSRPRCPSCDRPNAGGQAFCGHCGAALQAAQPAGQDWPDSTGTGGWAVGPQVKEGDSPGRRTLKAIALIWLVGYPVVSCAPLFTTGTDTAGGAAVGGLASAMTAGVLFFPWIVGLVILGGILLLTKR